VYSLTHYLRCLALDRSIIRHMVLLLKFGCILLMRLNPSAISDIQAETLLLLIQFHTSAETEPNHYNVRICGRFVGSGTVEQDSAAHE
jgi:hypothetical protein